MNQILSVINKQCYVKSEVPVSSIFNEDKVDSSLFYKQKFDLVVFEKQYSKDLVILAVELNGPEHYTDEEVIVRDKKKINTPIMLSPIIPTILREVLMLKGTVIVICFLFSSSSFNSLNDGLPNSS